MKALSRDVSSVRVNAPNGNSRRATGLRDTAGGRVFSSTGVVLDPDDTRACASELAENGIVLGSIGVGGVRHAVYGVTGVLRFTPITGLNGGDRGSYGTTGVGVRVNGGERGS